MEGKEKRENSGRERKRHEKKKTINAVKRMGDKKTGRKGRREKRTENRGRESERNE